MFPKDELEEVYALYKVPLEKQERFRRMMMCAWYTYKKDWLNAKKWGILARGRWVYYVVRILMWFYPLKFDDDDDDDDDDVHYTDSPRQPSTSLVR